MDAIIILIVLFFLGFYFYGGKQAQNAGENIMSERDERLRKYWEDHDRDLNK